MKLVSIFGENLFAIKYEGEEKDEFARLFELWQDAEYLEQFFDTHKADLQNGFWGDINVEGAIFETSDYAENLEQRLRKLSKQSPNVLLDGLDELFEPLHNSQIQIITLNKSKAKETWLRIYALRVDTNAYIITGGAIKLTQKMNDRKHTNRELLKIENCRTFLLEQGIIDTDGVIEEIEL
ncbi:MAG: hypothetical protein HN778_20760 [Prolixibacteraceae bacterium]|jgi:hypothetical protein|nr:hypothetical protein [Prolixibacteraceae bacterium]MBT6766714.1 hypothetical protein [Prolixibacteraceae bacterium]MBT7000440.1 hypothetical protein [Prolixibacteraceae bacterium]MBT7397267.1 hypothetical protein [Prolixibacteraceae bacterium]